MVQSGQQIGGLYVEIKGDTTDFDRDMDRAERSMERVEGTSTGLRSQIHALEGAFLVAGAAAAGLAISLGLMTRRYGQVDQQFARIQENTQATAAEMERMRAEALQLGAELPTTLRDSADGLTELTKAGLSAEQATDALAGTTYLAIAGQLQMAEAAKVTTSVLNAWSLEASKSSAVADMLASTAASASTEISEMGDAFRYASSTASQLGVSSQELSAFVGVLSNVGMEASIAGTSINQALLSIINPTEKARNALAKAGLSMEDFTNKNGELKEMSEILNLLNQQTAEMSRVQRQAMLADVFGIRGARAIGPALDNVEKYNELLAESSRAQIAGGISRLGGLSDQELSKRQQAVGFQLQPGSTRSVLKQYRQLAEREGLSQEQLATQIQLGLNVGEDAARLLAGDLTRGTDMDKLVAGLQNVSTAQEKAEASMQTFRGQVEQFTGAMDTFFYQVYVGATGPLSLLFGMLNPLADVLASNETAAHLFGAGLVVAAGAAGLATIVLGAMYAEAVLLHGGLLSTLAMTESYTVAQHGLAAASRVASGAIWLMTASLADIRAALVTSQAAQWATSASTLGLSGAYGVLTGAIGTATTAIYGFWTALGPIGWAIMAIIGLVIALKSGFLDWIGLGPEVDATLGVLSWALGGVADAIGGVGDVLGPVLGWLWELALVATKIAFLPLVLPIKAAGVALRYLGDGVEWVMGVLDPFQDLLDGSATKADLFKAALMAIPGVGLLVWVLDAVGAIDDLAASFERAMQKGKAFYEWLNPLGKGQSLGEWVNPLPDNSRGRRQRRRQRPQPRTQSNQSISAVNAPQFDVSLSLDELEGALQQGNNESVSDLRRDLETQLFQFQQGQ